MKKSEKLRNQSHSPLQQKRIKYLEISLLKERKEPCTENYKTLMKEIKDDTNRWKIYHVHGLEESIYENKYTT